MSVNVRFMIAGTMAMAVLMAGAIRSDGAEPADLEKLHQELNAQLQNWLKTSANGQSFRDALPAEIDLMKGNLEFPTPTAPRWVFKLPNVNLGPRKGPAQTTLTELLKSYLTAAGQQALDTVPDADREKVLNELVANAGAEIVDQTGSTAGYKVNPGGGLMPPGQVFTTPMPPALSPSSVSKAPVSMASPQSPGLFPSGQGVMSQAPCTCYTMNATPTVFQGWTPTTTYVVVDSRLNPYELFWSGQFGSAQSKFRALTASDPDDSTALYFQALAELATSNQIAAQTTLQRAAATEARTNASRQVSTALVRIQGPARDWIEAARRSPSPLPQMEPVLAGRTQSVAVTSGSRRAISAGSDTGR